ncbi:MAG: PQQ-dependent sugar dehydrogenase [Hyphomicrobiales bacterium]|jgi:glucose/arabinose dehydrogenase
MQRVLPITFAALAFAMPSMMANAQTPVEDTSGSCALVAETIASGLENPWGLAFLDANTALLTERPGAMKLVNLTVGSTQEVSGVPDVVDNRQGGMLDVVIGPDFASTNRIFFSFSEPRDGGTGTSIASATLEGWTTGAPSLANIDVIFQQSGPDGSGFHFGSRIVFLPDDTLAFTIGDRGTPERAQDPSDHAGSVLRINQDGSIPEDNPFTGPNETQSAIWSIGHRNPQGAALDPATGLLWTVEHGARGGDEINQPRAGLNYGWPTISYGVNYSGTPIGVGTEADGLEQPVYYWDPSIAPSGMAILSGAQIFPSWEGDMLVGALAGQMLVRLDRMSGNIVSEERLFEGMLGRIRDVRQGPDGAIWLLTDDSEGSLVRVSPQEEAC